MSLPTDERFLCGCGEDALLYIWDLSTGEVVFGQRLPMAVSVLQWVEHRLENRRMTYELVIGTGSILNRGILAYDPVRVQWTLKQQTFTMPPGGGIIRYFSCIDVSYDGIFVFIGTSGGDVLIFRRDTCVFRACIPVCTNGVKGIVALSDDRMLCGGGDGSVLVLEGSDMSWVKSTSVSNKATTSKPTYPLTIYLIYPFLDNNFLDQTDRRWPHREWDQGHRPPPPTPTHPRILTHTSRYPRHAPFPA